MAPFYGWGSTASRLEPLRGDSLPFTTKKSLEFCPWNSRTEFCWKVVGKGIVSITPHSRL